MARKDVSDFMVCKAIKEYHERGGYGKFPYEILSEETGEPEKVCYAAMERAFQRGYVEYGVSLRTGWLTDKGKELLIQEGGI